MTFGPPLRGCQPDGGVRRGPGGPPHQFGEQSPLSAHDVRSRVGRAPSPAPDPLVGLKRQPGEGARRDHFYGPGRSPHRSTAS